MFIKIIPSEGQENYMSDVKEVMIDCNHVSLRENPSYCASHDEPLMPHSILTFGQKIGEQLIINYPCTIIYMNNNGKTIDRKVCDENGTVKPY